MKVCDENLRECLGAIQEDALNALENLEWVFYVYKILIHPN